ncbi:MAG: hypothetical protein JOZ82_07165 [Marmoricola sp.]|nr:hypothetical protein [Marmoricola sp.]
MFGTKLIAATVAGAAVGAGTFALAPSEAATHTPTAHRAAAAQPALARNVIHGSWVTRNRVHHEAIRGAVKSVDAKFITVRAVDGFTQTYRVTKATKVHVAGHPGMHKITDVKVGDRALVLGVGNEQATHVVARTAKSAKG